MFSRYSVKKPFTVLVAVVLILVLGVVSVTNMTPDLLPEMEFPYVMIYTIYAGASPEEVETVVTRPVEQAVATLSNVKNVESVSGENYSLVSIEFNDDVNMDAITIDIREGLNAASAAWGDGVGTPTILKISPNMIPVSVAAVHYEGMNNVELSNLITDRLSVELESVEGVATIVETGVLTQTLDITIDQSKLDAVNERIFAAIDREFSEATKELDEAERELLEGQQELESQRELLEEGEQQLDSGRGAANREFAAAQAQLDSTQEELNRLESELTAQRAELVAAQASAISAQRSLVELQGTLLALTTAQEIFQASIRLIEENDALTEQQKQEYIAAITQSAEYQAVEEGLAQIDAALAEQGLTRDGIAQAIAELAELRVQLASGIEQIDAALTELAEGRLELEAGYELLQQQKDEVYSQLNAAQRQISAGKEALSAAEQQLADGETQLSEAQKLADAQLQAAYDSANLHNILTKDMIASILAAQNFSMPAGYVAEGDDRWLVQVGDKFETTDELSELVLFNTGLDGVGSISLSDIGSVLLSDNADSNYAKINGEDGILLSFTKQSTYASAEVASNIRVKMEELEAEYEGLTFTRLFDQGDYIDMAVGTVVENLIMGGVLAILILLLFLRDIRPTFIVACSIPISVMFALVLMYFSGVSINLISMAGLAVGVGMLVDNSIVVIENIYRLRSLKIPTKDAAVQGAVQVLGAVTASTLTTICVFAPIVFVQGITRQIFSDMALTIAYSLLASLIVALTLIPAMSRGLLRKEVKPQKARSIRRLDRMEKVLRFCLGHRLACIALALILLAGTAFLTLRKGFSYFPESGGTQISVTATLPDETKREEAVALADEMLNRLYAFDELSDVGGILSAGGITSLIGLTQESSDEANTITIYALIEEGSGVSSAKLSAQISEAMEDLSDRAAITVAGMSTMDYSTALGSEGVVINIYGTELEDMYASAAAVAESIRGVEGIVEVDDGLGDSSAALHITVDKNKAMEHNLTTAQVYLAIAEKLSGSLTATSILTEDGTVSVNVSSTEDASVQKSDILAMELISTAADGSEETVKLSSIAEITETETLRAINRSNQRRYVTVTASVEDGYNVTLVTSDVEKAVEGVELASGTNLAFEGENETIMSALEDLLYMLLLGVLIIYLIMVAQFQSLLSPFIVMFTVPLAFTGGFLALWLTGMDVSIVSMIGFIMLIGVVVNNGIVLVDCINQLREQGMEKREAILAAVRMRLRPVLMTALTTILGLLPLALGIGTGAEIIQPVAVVCIGGLTYATLMTLFIIPLMYDVFTRNRRKGEAEPPAAEESAESLA
ncbi:MAG: efflux RND transporter permease subunit [Clostridia bacterium]|nr:efflux RND transporter permease subunit [Clostridia bacterium]